MTSWHSGIVEWTEDKTAYLSVVFSWQLEKAFQRAAWFKAMGYEVIAGGPAVSVQPEFLDGVAVIESKADALWRHNPEATFTSRGCIRSCKFCIVPKIEGELVELDDWEVRPIICDNNFLATSDGHFNSVIDKLKAIRGIDFNQGLDARLLTKQRASRLAELDLFMIRFSWDHRSTEKSVMDAIELIRAAGIPKSKIRVFCLIGYKDTPNDALYRLQTIKDMGIMPFPMRYQPIATLRRNQYLGEHWNERLIRHFTRYWSKQSWLRGIPFEEYEHGGFKLDGLML